MLTNWNPEDGMRDLSVTQQQVERLGTRPGITSTLRLELAMVSEYLGEARHHLALAKVMLMAEDGT
jgi:hypothetical protein